MSCVIHHVKHVIIWSHVSQTVAQTWADDIVTFQTYWYIWIGIVRSWTHLFQLWKICFEKFRFPHFAWFNLLWPLLLIYCSDFHPFWSARRTELLVQNQQRVPLTCMKKHGFVKHPSGAIYVFYVNNMLLPKWPLHFFGCKEISTWGRLNRWDRPRLFGNTLAPG